jgi:hypothetical protein
MPKNITTPLGTAVWPHLNKPDKKFDPDGAGDYSVKLRIPADECGELVSELEAMADEDYKKLCREKKKPNLKRADFPWQTEYDEDMNDTGNIVFKFKMKAQTKAGAAMKPVLFDSQCQPLTEVIGAGSKIKVAFQPSCWFVAAHGAGISLRLRGVQVLQLEEYSGSSAESLGFDSEEGGFETVAAKLDTTEESTPTEDTANADDF